MWSSSVCLCYGCVTSHVPQARDADWWHFLPLEVESPCLGLAHLDFRSHFKLSCAMWLWASPFSLPGLSVFVCIIGGLGLMVSALETCNGNYRGRDWTPLVCSLIPCPSHGIWHIVSSQYNACWINDGPMAVSAVTTCSTAAADSKTSGRAE